MLSIKLVAFSVLVFCSHPPAVVNGANIVGLMTVPSPSHHIWNSALLNRLAELGHNVTVLSVDVPKPNEKLPPTVHYIHLEEGYSMYENEDHHLDITDLIGLMPFKSIELLYEFGWKSCAGVAISKGLKTLLNYPDDFKVDLMFYDYTLGPMLLGFLHKFKYPPLIGMSAYLNPPNTLDPMSNHVFPAYVPFHATSYGTEMNFWDRMHNTLLFITDYVYRRAWYYPKIESITRPHFPDDTPSLAELEKHTTLAMVNAHPVFTNIEPISQNIIEVGGMQIRDPKPLPKDFEEFLNKSRNGVVLVSFGTNMQSTDFNKGQTKVILDALAALPQYDFIWKFDVKHLKGKLPKNVKTWTFLPQGDLLAHPKTKAFVTHCGALSTYEAIYRGVPMVGVPLFYDQFRNIRQSVNSGIAVELDFFTMTSAQLRDAIAKVTGDPQIAENAKTIARRIRDRPMTPLDTAVWWTEYVLRNPHAAHLKSPASKLNILQANSLDVVFTLLAAFALVTWLTVKLLSLTVSKFTAPHRPPSASKAKTN